MMVRGEHRQLKRRGRHAVAGQGHGRRLLLHPGRAEHGELDWRGRKRRALVAGQLAGDGSRATGDGERERGGGQEMLVEVMRHGEVLLWRWSDCVDPQSCFAFPRHSLTSFYLTMPRVFDNPLIVDVMNASA